MSAKKAAKSKASVRAGSRNGVKELVFLFDVDNTLLDNDRFQSDLFRHIERDFGAKPGNVIWRSSKSCATSWDMRIILALSSAIARRSCTIHVFSVWRIG